MAVASERLALGWAVRLSKPTLGWLGGGVSKGEKAAWGTFPFCAPGQIELQCG